MRKLNEQRLAYFFEAVQCGSVRAAADKLDIAPSAVSRQIALLEQEVAIPVMERHRRGVVPTEAGQLLIDYYREQGAHQADLLSKLQGLRGLKRGHVSIVIGEGFVSDFMSQPMAYFAARHPQISISIDLAGTNEVLRQVAEDQAEIGLVYNPPSDPKIVSRAVQPQPMQVIVGPQSPLRNSKSCSLKELTEYPIGLMHESYGTRQLLALAEYAAKIKFNPLLSTNSINVLKHFVKSGQGITLLPRFSVSTELAAGELLAIPIDSDVLTTAEVHLITRVGRKLSVAANRLLSYSSSLMQAFQVTS
ncbi:MULTISPECIES: LysR family transcriptional regulator [unclassified Herbaspirillum]|uniref:LysR family transcriptional regulator n=1 Tax=unclassified Herbaspirillum TaxID=2624150 RepID=UPI001150188D|nr:MULTISPECIES: LysR family transcriptional regulator [unclassified Herbaspirillum]MBB5391684.1 DNA-binding transcriptional LysR family regulator [Herbaspirillum sp. SJZ102]TQK03069.1 DNA-binding transcriptional LysR family regulator [Herbaspirillum sp. SJZ130]TQK06543.1 DNA-binding transcriptional LysR family regulator [Herbaspirillum sp. SJZ106]